MSTDSPVLTRPSKEHIPQIADFREEFAGCLDWLHGASGLRYIADPAEWLAYSARLEAGLDGAPPYTQFLFVRPSDGRIVGYVSLYERGRTTASVGAEIIPCERGKGAASEALALLTRYASEQGYRVLLDQIRADNKASVRLHEKLGFETDGYVYTNQRGHEVLLYVMAI